MARAKRTDRAAARRRHRAAQGFTDAELDAAEAADEDALDTGGSAREERDRSASPMPPRLGIGAAFRMAFRPLDARSDFAAVPRLVRSKALWIPIALTVASASLVALFGIGTTDLVSVITNFLFQYFVFTPAIGGVFIAGFMAPRASWLLGIAVGLVAAICYSAVVLAFPTQVYATLPPQDDINASISGAFFLSPMMGALFASAAAWYRRFLALSSPNRSRRQAAASSRPDGRSRAANAAAKARR